MESKQTAQEALALALKTQREIHVRGSNLTKQYNHIIACNVLDAELGKYADQQPIYSLDQDTQDRLLVHARQDAAEALCHANCLMDEVHKLKTELRTFYANVWLFVAIYLLSLWWKSGFSLFGIAPSGTP